MNSQLLIKNFSVQLTKILKSELELGNSIDEVSSGWPNENSIFILLKFPFKNEYVVEDIEFTKVYDPHYWKSEYFDKNTNHLLACRF